MSKRTLFSLIFHLYSKKKKKKQKNYRISFSNSNQSKEGFDILHALWQKQTLPEISSPRRRSTLKRSREIESIFQELPNEDWDLIVSGAKSITLPKNGIILFQGEKYQKMFQINRGVCRIEVNY